MTRRLDALAAAARDWQDPDHPPRQTAAREAVAEGLTTEEAAAFACNQFAHACSDEALRAWGAPDAPFLDAVAVRCRGGVPMLGARAFAAAVLAARQVHLDTDDPLLGHFADDVAGRAGEGLLLENLADPSAILEAGTEDELGPEAARVPTWRQPSAPMHAVLDGDETDEEWIGLAEDLLLHDGRSPRSVRLVWAPEALAPDDLLDAMAGFRELFPARSDLDGTLQMPRAFLKAAGTPHAWAPGFLLSKGDAEPQAPGHVRWVPYGSLQELPWQREGGASPLVVASERLADLLGSAAVLAPGDAHRPPLGGHAETTDPLGFLLGLALR